MPNDPLRGYLPGYVWDERLRGGRYRHIAEDGRLGNIVSQREITANLRSIHDASALRYGNLAADAANGLISPAEFQRAMQAELKALYNGSSALARGGWSRMGPVEWGRNGQILRGEYRHLAGFAQDLADGKLTPEQAAARARLYSGKAYSRFWAEDALSKRDAGYHEERWDDTGDNRECADCALLAARGWVPLGGLGTTPGAGDTACLGNCRCELEYR